MIKHIVMWKLHDSALGQSKLDNAQKIKNLLESLQGQCDGLISIEVGIDFLQSSNSADIVLYSIFENRDALERYQQHPEHVAMKGFIGSVTASRQLVDYET